MRNHIARNAFTITVTLVAVAAIATLMSVFQAKQAVVDHQRDADIKASIAHTNLKWDIRQDMWAQGLFVDLDTDQAQEAARVCGAVGSVAGVADSDAFLHFWYGDVASTDDAENILLTELDRACPDSVSTWLNVRTMTAQAQPLT